MSRFVARIGAAVAGLAGMSAIAAAAPVVVLAHGLDATFESRLPLTAYLAGAAGAVGLSFLFVLARARPPAMPAGDDDAPELVSVPRPLRFGLRLIGLVGWAWIMVQGVLGGTSDAAVAPLFLWVYGWVGIALVSAFVGPVWHWLDPFTTLYDIGASILRRARPTVAFPDDPDEPSDEDAPSGLPVGRWPAVAGLALFIWLELALSGGGSALFAVVVGYTVLTLAGMTLYGRDAWRADGETFSVWFGLLGRLAPLALVRDEGAGSGAGHGGDGRSDADHGRLRRRGFATGVLEPGWTVPDVVLGALGIGSILFDGLSQTQIFFDVFGAPSPLALTPILAGFLAIVVGLAAIAARWVGLGAAGAGLLPIAVGYLAAHYATYLLIDGQRIIVAISDPFQQGWDLFGTAFFEPSAAWLPPGLVWTFQLLVVVGGHMIGAWAGHAAPGPGVDEIPTERARRLRQVPLAIVMVVLTSVTLWSLGQAVVKEPTEVPAARSVPAAPSRLA